MKWDDFAVRKINADFELDEIARLRSDKEVRSALAHKDVEIAAVR